MTPFNIFEVLHCVALLIFVAQNNSVDVSSVEF